MLQLIAAAIAVLFLVTGIVSPSDALAAIDLELLLILFALLMTVEILRASGYLDLIVKSAVARFRTTRSFGFAMVMFSGVLAMFVTNDVALFVVIPFTVIASRFSDFDIEDAVVLEIIATNLIGCLTPLGNPQNLYVYHRSGWNAGEFMIAMLPFVGWCTAGLIAALFLLGPSHEMKRAEVTLPERNKYAAVAGAICLALVIPTSRMRSMRGPRHSRRRSRGYSSCASASISRSFRCSSSSSSSSPGCPRSEWPSTRGSTSSPSRCRR